MANYTVKKIGEMEGAFGGGMRRARAELGVSSFGMQIEEFPPNFDQYPEHSHSEDGQEEVYVVLRGTAGPEGVRVLALGGVPGAAYEPPEFSKLGAGDPTSA